jgi:hypothetical protein
MSINARVALLVKDNVTLYTIWLQMYQRKDGLSYLIQNSTSLSAFGSFFFFENF